MTTTTPQAVLLVDRAVRLELPELSHVEVTLDDGELSGTAKAFDASETLVAVYSWTLDAGAVSLVSSPP